MVSAATEKAEFQKYEKDWRKIDDLCFQNDVDQFLLTLNQSDLSEENKVRNRQYKDRAVYYNVIGQTYRGLVSAAFNKDPQCELPPALEYLRDNVDGKGLSIYQQAQAVTGDVIRKGRAGMFVTFPMLVDGQQASRAQMQSGEMTARIEHIDAKDIINWRTKRVGNQERVVLVVFRQYEDIGIGYDTDIRLFYRVLSIDDETGDYIDLKYRLNDDRSFYLEQEARPRMANGQPWKEIPFIFVGSENNSEDVDYPPLMDLAEINIGHYRNSADYEDSVFYAGQAQPWASGLDRETYKLYKDENIYIGSKFLMPVPAGEQFGFAVAPPNPMVREAMKDKIDLMLNLGARLLQPGAGNKTATQVRTENAVSESVLGLIVSNVEEAYQIALGWCADYMGADAGQAQFEMSRDFGVDVTDPAEIAQMLAALMQGVIATNDIRDWLRTKGFIAEDRTNEEIDQDMAGVLPIDGDSITE